MARQLGDIFWRKRLLLARRRGPSRPVGEGLQGALRHRVYSAIGGVRGADDTGVHEEDLASTDLQGRQGRLGQGVGRAHIDPECAVEVDQIHPLDGSGYNGRAVDENVETGDAGRRCIDDRLGGAVRRMSKASAKALEPADLTVSSNCDWVRDTQSTMAPNAASRSHVQFRGRRR